MWKGINHFYQTFEQLKNLRQQLYDSRTTKAGGKCR